MISLNQGITKPTLPSYDKYRASIAQIVQDTARMKCLRELRDAPINPYHIKGLLIDVTHTDLQWAGHLERGSATIDGSATAISEARKSAHYARRGHMSFDERSFKLITLAVESFRRLGKCGEELLEQVASSVVGEQEGDEVLQKGVLLERMKQVISVTTQVAISRRLQRYRLALRGRQKAAEGPLNPRA